MAIDPRQAAMEQFAAQAAAAQNGGGGAPPPLPGAAPEAAGGVVSTSTLTGANPPTHAPGEPDPSYVPEFDTESGPYKLQTNKRRKSTKPKHLWEEAADEVTEWVLSMADDVADALLFHGHSPFAATLTEAEKLAYYRDVLRTPEGRDALMQRAGVDGYVRVVAALAENSPQSLVEPPAEKSRRDQEAPGYS